MLCSDFHHWERLYHQTWKLTIILHMFEIHNQLLACLSLYLISAMNECTRAWDIELNTWGEILYLCAPIHYSLSPSSLFRFINRYLLLILPTLFVHWIYNISHLFNTDWKECIANKENQVLKSNTKESRTKYLHQNQTKVATMHFSVNCSKIL